MENIFDLIKTTEKNLLTGRPIKIGKYASHDHTEKIAKIDAYINSQHISGSEDSLGREKPFFNISLFVAYTWYKMTDFDRKDLNFRPANSKQRLKSLVASEKMRDWMNRENFGEFLNKWGWTLAVYGSAVSKFVEKDGLIPSVISWDRMICDPLDFENNPKIEKIYYTPAQLRQQPYDKDSIEKAIESFKDSRETLDGQEVDARSDYIGVYEVHGELPLSFLTDKEEDKETYRQQMHVVFIQENTKQKEDVRVSLYRGKEARDPYYLSHLIDQERTLSIGAVESVFEPQWMVNNSVKQTKDQLDLSTKIILQTSDQNFMGRNAVTDAEVGDVWITADNRPISPVDNRSHDINQIMGYMNQWQEVAREISGTHEAITGEQPPSGTPYRLQMMLNTAATGLFDIMKQNKSLHLEQMLRRYILPYFKKTLKNSEELIAVLDGKDLETFDKLALPAKLEQQIMASIAESHIPTREELMTSIQQQDNELGNTRIMKPSNQAKTWEEYFKNFEWDAEVDIAGENKDKSATLTSLNSLLERMMTAPELFAQEDIKKVFNKIVDEIDDISPLQFSDEKGVPSQAGTPTGGEPKKAPGGSKVGMPNLTPTI